MPPTPHPDLRPRKSPVQRRSEATIETIFEATIQVLLSVGYRQLTTTRVAERAGLSVGTLYQYFPNKQALLASVMARSLDQLAARLEACCAAIRGQNATSVATALVDAYLAAKLERANASMALRDPLNDVGGAQAIQAITTRIASALVDTLEQCPDLAFEDTDKVAEVVITATSALMHMALEKSANNDEVEAIRAHAQAMVNGYLQNIGNPRAIPEPRRGGGASV